MNDRPDDRAETPMQRALRMKKAARAAKPKAPGQDFKPEQAARMPAGASKPWMKR
jgi:hypothetical protein